MPMNAASYAFAVGYTAYMHDGQPHDNPFSAGTTNSTQWALGFELAGEQEVDAAEASLCDDMFTDYTYGDEDAWDAKHAHGTKDGD